jgi:lipid A 4'-phosphatase
MERKNIMSLIWHLVIVTDLIILGYIFYMFPQIDIGFSSLFYNAQEGFFLDMNPIVKLLHKAVPVISVTFVIIAGVLGLKTIMATKSIHPKHYMKIIYVTLVCLIGPGFIVHNVVKDNFGRARPNEVVQFGGEKKFTAAFEVSNQCSHNCSFVSGHASVGFMFLALAFLYEGRKKVVLSIISVALGLLIGLARVMEGDHYLSDIIFAGGVVYLTAYYLDKLLKPRDS